MPTKGRVWKARKTGKVVVKERSAATPEQGDRGYGSVEECGYCSARGSRPQQFEMSTVTAMREECG